MNQVLMASGYPYVNIRVQDRLEYYRVLNEASMGDILEFERFIALQMSKTLKLYLDCTVNDLELQNQDKLKIENFRDTIELR